MSKVIQISDPHIVPNGQRAYGKVDTAAALIKIVAAINAKLPQIGPVDLAVVTGDLTDFGTSEEYDRFQKIMEPLAIPYRAVPGNHDAREAMRHAFSTQDWMAPDGPLDSAIRLPDFVLVAMDTLVEGAAHGELSAASLRFLADQMAKHPGTPFLVGLHHPPFETGIEAMDIQNLKNPEPLCEILSNHAAEVRLICGHVHRNIVKQCGGIICQIAPGTSHAVTLEQRNGSTNTLTVEPGAFLLHEWRSGFVSHQVFTADYEGPYPFYPDE